MAEEIKKSPLDQEETKAPVGTGIGTTSNSAEIKPPKEKKKETVEVEKDVLERILATVEKQGEKIKILTEVADKNRLTRVEELRAQGKLVKKVKLNYMDGNLIIGWKTIKDEVYFDQDKRLHEEQIIGLYFEQEIVDGQELQLGKEMPYQTFGRLVTKVPVEVIEEGKDRDGNTNFVVETDDGRKIKIDSRFVN